MDPREKTSAIKQVLGLDGTIHTLSKTTWQHAEHTFHELAHAYLLGWSPFHHKRADGWGLSDELAVALKRPAEKVTVGGARRRYPQLSHKLLDEHELCACAVTFQVLTHYGAGSEREIANWMDAVVNINWNQTCRSTRKKFWRIKLLEPGVLHVAAKVIAFVEAFEVQQEAGESK